MRVLFWGSPEFALLPLEAILGSVHSVVGVVCQPDRPSGRGRKIAAPAVKRVAGSHGLLVIQPEIPRGEEFLARLRSLHPDISVVVAYGHILRPEVLYLPGHGSMNLHASLLPAYRGAAPIQRAIAAGESFTGLTVIRMDEGMDTGPVLAWRRVDIGPQETAGELSRRLSESGAKLLVEVLDRIAGGEDQAVPQPAQGISYAPKISREEAHIDWTMPADKITCLIRAFDPEPGAFGLYQGAELKIFRAMPADIRGNKPGEVVGLGRDGLVVSCGDGRAVVVREVQAQGKKRMSAEEYLHGSRMTSGAVLE